MVGMENHRIPKIQIFGELMKKTSARRNFTTWESCLRDGLKQFGVDKSNWQQLVMDEKEWLKRVDGGAETFMFDWTSKKLEKNREGREKLVVSLLCRCGYVSLVLLVSIS